MYAGDGRRQRGREGKTKEGEGLGKLSKSVLYCHTVLPTDLHTERRQTITAMLHSKNLCQELQQEAANLLSQKPLCPLKREVFPALPR